MANLELLKETFLKDLLNPDLRLILADQYEEIGDTEKSFWLRKFPHPTHNVGLHTFGMRPSFGYMNIDCFGSVQGHISYKDFEYFIPSTLTTSIYKHGKRVARTNFHQQDSKYIPSSIWFMSFSDALLALSLGILNLD